MKFRLLINCISVAAMFGIWQANYFAGAFMFTLLGACISFIDYFKEIK